MYYNSLFRAFMVELKQRFGRRKETRKILSVCEWEGKKILDIGCNLGYLSGLIAKRAAFVMGIDTNHKAITWAKIRNYGVDFFWSRDGKRLPFTPDFFDAVVLSHVLEHFEDPAPLLDEIKKILKKDGSELVVIVPKEEYLGQNTPDHKALFQSSEDLQRVMKAHAFKVLQIMDIGKSIIARCALDR
ncbi:MAG: class I SAM-dependent methyltransferase [Parcubacteria group bacterium]|jgi:SAM-dependent methyltransferase